MNTDCANAWEQTRWYVGSTASRHEKQVARYFSQSGIEHFLPLYHTIHRWNNGKHEVQLPVFPGYIFVRIALCNRLQVLETPGFVRLVGFGGMPVALPPGEIESMQRAFESGIHAEPHAYLSAGTRVEIVRGPLKGLNGILLRLHGCIRVVLSIDLILRSIVVEVEADNILPVTHLMTNHVLN